MCYIEEIVPVVEGSLILGAAGIFTFATLVLGADALEARLASRRPFSYACPRNLESPFQSSNYINNDIPKNLQ